MNTLSKILLGAAVVGVGYLLLEKPASAQTTTPPQPQPPQPPTTPQPAPPPSLVPPPGLTPPPVGFKPPGDPQSFSTAWTPKAGDHMLVRGVSVAGMPADATEVILRVDAVTATPTGPALFGVVDDYRYPAITNTPVPVPIPIATVVGVWPL